MRFFKRIKASTIGVSRTIWLQLRIGWAYVKHFFRFSWSLLDYPVKLFQQALGAFMAFLREIATSLLRYKILRSCGKDISEKTKQNLSKNNPNGFRLGYCNICGSKTAFLYYKNRSMRESLVCNNCGSISRYRSLARGILRAIYDLTGIESQSISNLPRAHNVSLSIYDTQASVFTPRSTYALPDFLSRCKWIGVQCSVYAPNMEFGRKLKRNLSNQNIEALSFGDSSFDIVITSDVLEHVRLDDQAHLEIRRVLKPGGIYVFTVPNHRQSKTLHRVFVRNPSNPADDQFLTEKEFHDDPNVVGKKSLVYRIYGTDLDKKLEELGFEVHYECQDINELGIVNTELFFCKLKSKQRATE
jgi:O-antigen biosynthesis protein